MKKKCWQIQQQTVDSGFLEAHPHGSPLSEYTHGSPLSESTHGSPLSEYTHG